MNVTTASILLISPLQLASIIIFAFGLFLFALGSRRKYLRSRVQGLKRFMQTDRAAFTRNSENLIQRLGLALAVSGILIFSAVAIKQSQVQTDYGNAANKTVMIQSERLLIS